MAQILGPGAQLMSTTTTGRTKLTGRAFYESIGRPKYIVAPMVDRSEFAWRMLTRSYMNSEESKKLLAYSPMLHARLFGERAAIRDDHFQPTKQSLTAKEESNAPRWLDGNPEIDRPLFVQFCANKPDELLDAAQYVVPYCDAVDLNLGCPQGIARAGKYGAFLQEDWDTIYKLINKLHTNLTIPITAKMRILDTKERTLEYAKMILSAGASILTVHGRRREQKGHNTGVADWTYIRYLRDNLPPETVIFANGNILNPQDLDDCLRATGADGIMSAEGNLSDPTIFAKPPTDVESREYWRGEHGIGGYRIDGVIRRYLDIIYKYVLEKNIPERPPLYILSDRVTTSSGLTHSEVSEDPESEGPPRKKQKKGGSSKHSPNVRFLQGHLFQLLRPMLSIHTDIRDTLAKTRPGDMSGFEKVLSMVERVTRKGMEEEAAQQRLAHSEPNENGVTTNNESSQMTDSERTAAKYRRPWWVCQPHLRPLPEEAIKIGAMTVGKKDRAKMEAETERKIKEQGGNVQRSDEEARPEAQQIKDSTKVDAAPDEVPKAALVCG